MTSKSIFINFVIAIIGIIIGVFCHDIVLPESTLKADSERLLVSAKRKEDNNKNEASVISQVATTGSQPEQAVVERVEKQALDNDDSSELVADLKDEITELEGRLLRYEQAEERIAPHVDTPELRFALAQEYFELLNFDEQINMSFEPMLKSYLNEVPEEAAEEISAAFNANFGWDAMEQDMLEAMAEVFDANDLKDIVNFQKSEVGIRLAEKQPELMQKMMEKMGGMQATTQSFSQEIEEILKKYNVDEEAEQG